MDTNSHNGWVRLYRSLLDSDVFQDDKLWKVWCYCLMKATYRYRKILFDGHTVHLKQGQFIFGRNSASEAMSVPPSTVWKKMKILKSIDWIAIKSNSHYSVVTVLEWNTYESNPDDLEHSNNTNKNYSNKQARKRTKGSKNKDRSKSEKMTRNQSIFENGLMKKGMTIQRTTREKEYYEND